MRFRNTTTTFRAFAWPAAIMIAGLSNTAFAGPQFSEWSIPMAVPGVAGGCPMESHDGNTLYTASGRDGTTDIFIYERDGRAGTFQGPTKVEDPVSLDNANDLCPTPLQGGWLLFVSNRTGGCGGNDIYITKNNPAKGWSDPINLGCAPEGPNTVGSELSPSLVTTSEGSYLYFSSNCSPEAEAADECADEDIYKSLMSRDGSFGPGDAVDELNTGSNDRQPNVRRDGLEIVFASNRPGSVSNDIWTASRESVDEEWIDLRNLSAELPTPSRDVSETRPSLSWDRKRLYYGSGGTIYVGERKPGRGPR